MAPTKTKEVGIRLSVKDAAVAERALEAFGKEGQGALKRIQDSAEPASVSIRALNAAMMASNVHLGRISGSATFTSFVRGAASALIPAIGLTAALQGARDAMDEFSRISDDAKSSGVTTDFLQETAYAASQAGVGYDELSAALIAFNKNAGQAEVGKGRMITALKALNPELLQNILLARTQEERVRLAAEAIDQAGGASEKAALATALFGDAGARMVEVFKGGKDALDATAASARELGIVVDSSLIARAEELGDEFETASKIMDLQFKQILIDLAPFIVGTAQAIAGIAAAVRDVWHSVGEAPAMQNLQARTAPLDRRATPIMQEQLASTQAALDKALADPDHAGWANTGIGATEAIASLQKEVSELQAAIDARVKPENFDVNGVFDTLSNLPKPDIFAPRTGGGDGTGGAPNAAAAKAIREAEQLYKRLQTASEGYATTVKQLDEMQAKGLITQETHNRGVAEAALKLADAAKLTDDYGNAQQALDAALQQRIITETQYTDAVAAMTKRRLESSQNWLDGVRLGLQDAAREGDKFASRVGDAVSGAFDGAADVLTEFVRTGKLDFSSLVDSITKDLIKLSIQQSITGPLAGGLNSLISGFFGSGGGAGVGINGTKISGVHGFATGGDFTVGGFGGPDSQLRALRLTPGERVSIRRPDQQSDRERGGARVEIHNYSGQPVKEEQGKDADGIDVTRIIIGAVNSGIAEGRFDQVMGTTFGVKRKGF